MPIGGRPITCRWGKSIYKTIRCSNSSSHWSTSSPGCWDAGAPRQGWLEGYLLTGQHGFFSCYETFIHIVDSMFKQHAKWLDMNAAIRHCTAGLGIWEWASNDEGSDLDVVMACCGNVPTLETLAAVEILREHFPELKIRVINVVDLMSLQPHSEHSHGLSDQDFDTLFTRDKLLGHKAYIKKHGEGMLEIHEWKWKGSMPGKT